MKRLVSVLGYILFVLTVLLPFGTLFSACFGYIFELSDITAFAVVTALLTVCLTLLSINGNKICKSGIINVLFALLAPLSLINAVLYMLEDSRILIVACMFICVGCSVFLTIKYGRPLALKRIALALSALMILPICFFGFITLFFGNIGQNTIVKSIKSPNGVYYAQVINSDQGALGGDTLVDVCENKGINALIFKISKKPQTVYLGDWGEFENMEIYWKDDSCLIINSVEYNIE